MYVRRSRCKYGACQRLHSLMAVAMANYSRLCALMCKHRELSLLKGFTDLNLKNLLYMQSELIHLQAELNDLELDDSRSRDPEKVIFQVSVFDLKESVGTENDLQWRKALEVRGKLKEYSL